MIYVIGNKTKPKRVKIGFSRNPDERLKQLQTGSPVELFIFCTFKGNISEEKQLHKVFEKQHSHGEWFNYTGYLKSCIIAYNQNSLTNKVTSAKQFLRAGMELSIRQKKNRTGNSFTGLGQIRSENSRKG